MSQVKPVASPEEELSYRRGYRMGWLQAANEMGRLVETVGVSVPTAKALLHYHAKIELGRWERKERADRKLQPPAMPSPGKPLESGSDEQQITLLESAF